MLARNSSDMQGAADHGLGEVMSSRLRCGHDGPHDDRANYLWCDTCRCWVHVEKRENM
jgi:prepilin-type processing-associated H-X9-DG protein